MDKELPLTYKKKKNVCHSCVIVVALVKGWLCDVEMEQCERRSHKGTTSPSHWGTVGVCDECLSEKSKGKR